MNEPDIDDVVTAFTSLSQSISDEKIARENHNGYSWDYYGSSYINEVEKYRDLCASRLQEYIDYRIEEKLKGI